MQTYPHWSERYVGRPYDAEEYDCIDFVVDVLKEQFHRELLPPNGHGHEDREGRAKVIRDNIHRYVRPTGKPEEGDGVLMNIAGRDQHIGIYVEINHVPFVLHNQRTTGVVVIRIRELNRWGYKVEGFYKWI
jgi:hypothetical protein